MKWQEYAINGYRYVDYLQLSQWQRFLWVWSRMRGRKGILHLSFTIHLWPSGSWKTWGIDTSQEYEHFQLGPLHMTLAV